MVARFNLRFRVGFGLVVDPAHRERPVALAGAHHPGLHCARHPVSPRDYAGLAGAAVDASRAAVGACGSGDRAAFTQQPLRARLRGADGFGRYHPGLAGQLARTLGPAVDAAGDRCSPLGRCLENDVVGWLCPNSTINLKCHHCPSSPYSRLFPQKIRQ